MYPDLLGYDKSAKKKADERTDNLR